MSCKLAPWLAALGLGLALGLTGLPVPVARAECLGLSLPPPRDLNICRELVKDLLIPPVFQQEPRCDISGFGCALMPHCCLPGACLAFAECYTVQQVLVAAGYVAHAGEVYCGVQELSAQDILDDLATGRIEDWSTLATGGVNSALYTLAGAQVDILACGGDPLPAALQRVLRELVSKMPNPGFDGIDLRRVDLIPESTPTAGPYLPSARNAVTLDSLVIMKDDLYDAQSGFRHSWRDVLNGKATHDEEHAMILMTHELVHVRQYREVGRETFLNTYLPDAIANGYGSAAFEREAEAFEDRAEQELERRRGRWHAMIGAVAPLL